MANQAWDDFLNGQSGGGTFQYGQAIRGPASSYETPQAYEQKMQGQNEARDLQNWYLRNQQTAFDNQQGTLKSLFSGVGGAGASVPDDNRFAAGLTDAESRLRALLDNPDSINQSAAYKFRVGQGQEALQRSLGAKGMLNSGNRLAELTKYGQDIGSQEYDAQYGRLGSLLGNYSTGYLGDKNANTARFSAESNAKANEDRTRLGFANLQWDMSKPQVMSGSRSSGGSTAGVYSNPFSPIQSDPWSYNTGSYDGVNSWFTNDQTGAQQMRRG